MCSHAADSDTPNRRAPVALWLLFGFGSYSIQSGFLGGLTWRPLRVMAR